MKKTRKINKSQPEIKQSKKKHRFRTGRLAILVFILTVFGTSGWQLYQLQSNVNERMIQLDTEKQKLLQEKAGLEKEIVKLNTPSYVEQLAREQLGLVRKGEIMISPKKQ